MPRRQCQLPERGTLPGTKWYLGALSGIQVVAKSAHHGRGIRYSRRNNVHGGGGSRVFKNVVTDSLVAEVASFVTYCTDTGDCRHR